MGKNTKDTGNFGENKAAEYLTDKLYHIVLKNYYGTRGEIDVIALTPDKSTYVFVEVKTRQTKNFGLAAESIGKAKIQSLVRTAEQFMIENPSDKEIRFDVIEVYYKMDGGVTPVVTEINHIENAFLDLCEYL